MLSVSRKPGWRCCRRRRRSIRKCCRRLRRPRCKAVDRGQITGAVLDGPLALDNAISPEAASIKRVVSPVAGRANVLVVPDLEVGNMLAKGLPFLARDCGYRAGCESADHPDQPGERADGSDADARLTSAGGFGQSPGRSQQKLPVFRRAFAV